jgi:hypothetical protein
MATIDLTLTKTGLLTFALARLSMVSVSSDGNYTVIKGEGVGPLGAKVNGIKELFNSFGEGNGKGLSESWSLVSGP